MNSSASRLSVLLVTTLGLLGCNPWSERCESLCTQLMNECQYSAWATTEQCRKGCTDDLYRRDDAAEVMSCYENAVAVPSSEEAASRVARAREAGLFDKAIEAGTWDQATEEARAVQLGTCDLFAFVQCKVGAVQVEPTLPLIGD